MKALLAIFVTGLLCCGLLSAVQAHEVRPGYLELRQSDAEMYQVLWKVPARGDRRLGLYVDLPEHCTGTPPRSQFAGSAYIVRWQMTCAGGLVGGTVAIDGLSATFTDVLARVQRLDGTTQTVRLRGCWKTPDRTISEHFKSTH